MLTPMHKHVLVIAMTFFIAACGSGESVLHSSVLPTSTGTVATNLNRGGVVFAQYSDKLIGRGKNSVLFFAHPSDPFSVKNDAIIRSVYGTGAAIVSTYRLDFPTATGARLKYGVLTADTFVLLDASGVRIATFIHPSADEIRIILRGNLPVSSQS